MFDVVVIGAGHNGLTAAAYLAQAGLKTLVVERRDIVGGCAVTEEIDPKLAPGCRVSTASYIASMLRPEVIRDLHLADYGLQMIACDPTVQTALPGGRVVSWWSDKSRMTEELRRIAPHDAQRIQRAMEIYLETGLPPSAAHGPGPREASAYRFIKTVLTPTERSVLHQRIQHRFAAMLKEGLVDEVKSLLEQYDIPPNAPSLRAVGYRQVLNYLTNRIDYSEMADQGVAATRQLAKRQLTWLRRGRGLVWFDGTKRGSFPTMCAYMADKLALLGL